MFQSFLLPVSVFNDQRPYLMVKVSFPELKLIIMIKQRRPNSNHTIPLLLIQLNKPANLLKLLDLLHGLIVNILPLLDKPPLALLQFPREGKLPQYKVDIILEVLDDVIVVLEELDIGVVDLVVGFVIFLDADVQ